MGAEDGARHHVDEGTGCCRSGWDGERNFGIPYGGGNRY